MSFTRWRPPAATFTVSERWEAVSIGVIPILAFHFVLGLSSSAIYSLQHLWHLCSRPGLVWSQWACWDQRLLSIMVSVVNIVVKPAETTNIYFWTLNARAFMFVRVRVRACMCMCVSHKTKIFPWRKHTQDYDYFFLIEAYLTFHRTARTSQRVTWRPRGHCYWHCRSSHVITAGTRARARTHTLREAGWKLAAVSVLVLLLLRLLLRRRRRRQRALVCKYSTALRVCRLKESKIAQRRFCCCCKKLYK